MSSPSSSASYPSRTMAILLMVIGVCGMSSSVIFIKISKLGIYALTSGRLLLTVVLLTPLLLASKRKAQRLPHGLKPGWWMLSILPGLFFAGHLLSWAVGARLTTSANATLAVNTAPLVLPFLLFWIASERVTKVEIAGTGIAFVGLIILTVADAQVDPAYLKGDLICLGSMLLLAVYIALGRRILPQLSSPWLYSVPLYFFAGLACLFPALYTGQWQPLFAEGALKEWLCLLGLAVVPTIFGHGLSMISLRVLRGQVVSVMSLGQFISAGILAWLVFGEQPHGPFYLAALFVVLGCGVVIWGRGKAAPAAPSAVTKEESPSR